MHRSQAGFRQSGTYTGSVRTVHQKALMDLRPLGFTLCASFKAADRLASPSRPVMAATLTSAAPDSLIALQIPKLDDTLGAILLGTCFGLM